MSLTERLQEVKASIPEDVTLVAVSKTHPAEMIREVYDAGQRIFGENRPQELREKYPLLPPDIRWHMIGHLQTNKVKYIAPFVELIHSVDSDRLLAAKPPGTTGPSMSSLRCTLPWRRPRADGHRRSCAATWPEGHGGHMETYASGA